MRIFTLLSPLIFLCAGFCCPEERDYENYDFEQKDLVIVENDTSSISINDTLWVSITIPKDLIDAGDVKTDIYELSGKTENAFVNFNLLKKGEFETPSNINLTPAELVEIKGRYDIYNGSISTVLVYENGFYTARFGILLKERGQFILRSVDHDQDFIFVYLDSKADNTITVKTGFKNSDDALSFAFTVQ